MPRVLILVSLLLFCAGCSQNSTSHSIESQNNIDEDFQDVTQDDDTINIADLTDTSDSETEDDESIADDTDNTVVSSDFDSHAENIFLCTGAAPVVLDSLPVEKVDWFFAETRLLNDNYLVLPTLYVPGLSIVDISNPEHLSVANTFQITGMFSSLHLYGNIAFIAETISDSESAQAFTEIVDLSDVSTPKVLGIIDGSTLFSDTYIAAVKGHYEKNESGYYAFFADSVELYDISEPSVIKKAGVFDAQQANTVTNDRDMIFLQKDNGRQITVINVSDIYDPKTTGTLNRPESGSIRVLDSKHLLFGSNKNSAEIVDISDINNPVTTASFPAKVLTVEGTLLYLINSEKLYIKNISNPALPENVSETDAKDIKSDPWGVRPVVSIGNYRLIPESRENPKDSSFINSYAVIDLTDIRYPELLSEHLSRDYVFKEKNNVFFTLTKNILNSEKIDFNKNNPARIGGIKAVSEETFAAQNSSITNNYFSFVSGIYLFAYMKDSSGDHIVIYDISDKTAPVIKSTISASPVEIRVLGSNLFVATLKNLHVYDIANIENPVLIKTVSFTDNGNYNCTISDMVVWSAFLNIEMECIYWIGDSMFSEINGYVLDVSKPLEIDENPLKTQLFFEAFTDNRLFLSVFTKNSMGSFLVEEVSINEVSNGTIEKMGTITLEKQKNYYFFRVIPLTDETVALAETYNPGSTKDEAPLFYDISDPENPLKYAASPGENAVIQNILNSVLVAENMTFDITDNIIRVTDISDKHKPVALFDLTTRFKPEMFLVKDSFLYTFNTRGIDIYDLNICAELAAEN